MSKSWSIPYFSAVVLSIPLFGCSPSNEQGIKDSRVDYMIELKKELDNNRISFTVDDEGYIRYPYEHKETVEKIVQHIDELQNSEIGSKFADELSTLFFRKLLDQKGIPYQTGNAESGEWTYWRPENKQQQSEIELEVVSHTFEQRSR